MKRHILIIAALLFSLLIAPAAHVHAQTPVSVVRAVLFYSPTCPHCEFVINETLPPLIQKYGQQLQIIGINVSEEQGATLFLAALDTFKLEKGGVPFLVIGDQYLIGSGDIPEQLPGLIETYLTQGGVDWPDLPGLREAMAETVVPTQESAPTVDPALPKELPQEPAPTTAPSVLENPVQESAPAVVLDLPEAPVTLTWQEKYAQDKSGNTLAVLVLAAMFAAVTWTGFQFRQGTAEVGKHKWGWIIPILCIFGFGVAGYLAYVETAQVAAVCGPVGDCNTVQQSAYARLFGILPIGVMGLAGYVAIMIAWLIARYTKDKIADFAALSMFGMAVFGTLFSIYLTFLEPFVIGATCAWCLTSAVLITIIMLLSIRSAKAAFTLLRYHPLSS